MQRLGIDIGGSGIKAAIVDTYTGELVSERLRVEAPKKLPDVVEAVAGLVKQFDWKEDIGCAFPAVVQQGKILTASNIDTAWIGKQADSLFSEACGLSVSVLNDADAAGMAEMRFGVGKDRKGTVIIVTVGTGIGTAIFTNGHLLPNTEFGHVILKGKIAEAYCSDFVRKKLDLAWKEWGLRFNEYLSYLDKLFYPELVIVGGGASKKFEKFSALLNIQAQILPAGLLNDAGIVGAALATKP